MIKALQLHRPSVLKDLRRHIEVRLDHTGCVQSSHMNRDLFKELVDQYVEECYDVWDTDPSMSVNVLREMFQPVIRTVFSLDKVSDLYRTYSNRDTVNVPFTKTTMMQRYERFNLEFTRDIADFTISNLYGSIGHSRTEVFPSLGWAMPAMVADGYDRKDYMHVVVPNNNTTWGREFYVLGKVWDRYVDCSSYIQSLVVEDQGTDYVQFRLPVQRQQTVLNYNYDVLRLFPADIYKKDPKTGTTTEDARNNPLTGVELETSWQDGEDLEYFFNNFYDEHGYQDFIVKEDGSIDDYDGEIVTRPMQMGNQKAFWAQMLDELDNSDARSGQDYGCGCHIHVDRKGLTPLTLSKMLVFVNLPANQKFIKEIAERSSAEWARVSEKKLEDAEGHKAFESDKYEALNLSKQATVEFRIFNGTTDKRTMLSYIDFVYAVVDFCKKTNRYRLNTGDFIAWLGRYPVKQQRYPDLMWKLAKIASTAPNGSTFKDWEKAMKEQGILPEITCPKLVASKLESTRLQREYLANLGNTATMIAEWDAYLKQISITSNAGNMIVEAVSKLTGKRRDEVLDPSVVGKDSLTRNFIDATGGEDSVLEQLDNISENLLEVAVNMVKKLGNNSSGGLTLQGVQSRLESVANLVGVPYKVWYTDNTRNNIAKRRITLKAIDTAARATMLMHAVANHKSATFINEPTMFSKEQEEYIKYAVEHGKYFSTIVDSPGKVKVNVVNRQRNVIGTFNYTLAKDPSKETDILQAEYRPRGETIRTSVTAGDAFTLDSSLF